MDSKAALTGSIWRRWDLYLHAPGTKMSNAYGEPDDETWGRFIDALNDTPVRVFGITGYFSGDTYFELVHRYGKKWTCPDLVEGLLIA